MDRFYQEMQVQQITEKAKKLDLSAFKFVRTKLGKLLESPTESARQIKIQPAKLQSTEKLR